MKKYILLLFITLAVTSCGEDFLNLSPSSSITTEEAITTLKDVGVANEGLYALMASTYYYNSSMFLYGDVKGDDMQPTSWSSGRTCFPYYMFEHSAQSANSGGLWGRPYYIIRNAYNIIDAIDNGKITDASAEELKNYKGQALAIIALCHFDLTRVYGYPYAKDNGASLGVPIVDHAIGFDEYPDRSTVAQCYEFVIDLLQEAIPLLSTNRDNGHINAYAARALLARVYLYANMNAEAYNEASSLIETFKANNVHTLATRENYSAMFAYDNKFGSEAIFQIANTTSANPGRDGLSYLLNWWGYAAVILTNDFRDFMLEDPDDVRNEMYIMSENGNTGEYFPILIKYPGPNGYMSTAFDNNYTVIRLSELYLIAAEAGLKSGGDDRAGALAYLNAIVERGNPAKTVSDAEFSLDRVLDERRKELVGEGHRYFDMLRNGKTMVRSGGNHLPGAPVEVNWDYEKCVLPIAKEQFTFNPDMVQNPGYSKE